MNEETDLKDFTKESNPFSNFHIEDSMQIKSEVFDQSQFIDVQDESVELLERPIEEKEL